MPRKTKKQSNDEFNRVPQVKIIDVQAIKPSENSNSFEIKLSIDVQSFQGYIENLIKEKFDSTYSLNLGHYDYLASKEISNVIKKEKSKIFEAYIKKYIKEDKK